MLALKRKIMAPLLAVLLVFTSVMPAVSYADRIDERPTAAEMTMDAVARPVMLAGTAIGAALFIVTLPFSVLGGNSLEAGNVLVVGPFKSTFMRCLGCSKKNQG